MAKAKSHHLALSLSRELWEELLKAALPVKIYDGEFDVAKNARQLLRQLELRQRVAGLLEDRRPPQALVRVKNRAKKVWSSRKDVVYKRLSELVRVEGTYRLELDDLGTNLQYGRQQVSADAFLKGVAEGKITLLRENVEFPFIIEKRVGASVTLKDIHYDPSHRAVIGSFADLGVHLGDNVVWQLLSRAAEYALEQQIDKVNPLPILKQEQVQDLVSPLGGTLRVNLGVEDLELVIDEDDMTLRVRFGFSHLQLPATDQDRTSLS